MKTFAKFWLSTFLFIGFSSLVLAEVQVAQISNLSKPFDVAPFIETIEDRQLEYQLNDVVAGKYENLWKKNTSPVLIAKHSQHKYWFRLNYRLPINYVGNSYLLVDTLSGISSHLGFVLVQDGLAKETMISGRSIAYADRDMLGLLDGIKIAQTQSDVITIIGWVDNIDSAVPVTLPIKIYDEAGYQAKQEQRLIILVAFYSSMGALLLYNLCLFISLREKFYGLYVSFLFSAILTCFGVDGTLAQWVFPLSPSLDYKFGSLNGFLSAILYLAFIYTALDGKQTWPKILQYIYNFMIVLGVVFVTISTLLGNSYAAVLTQIFSSLVLPLAFLAIILAIKQKIPLARFLLIAEICVLTGSIGFILLLHGSIPFNQISLWGMHFGFGAEALLLSLAVAGRTSIIIQEKFKAQQLAYQNERKALMAVENAAKTKNQFLATVSHELRTPLNSILGFSDLLLDDKYVQGVQRDYAQTISENGKQLLSVINDVLQLSLIDSNRYIVTQSKVNIRNIIQGIEVKYRLTAHQKQLKFVVDMASDFPELVELDSDSVTQILRQLLDNAFKFTHFGVVTLAIRKIDNTLVIRVKDSGVGIAKDKLESIFSPFMQGDNSNTRQYNGTGVGLYIAKEVSDKIGADLTVMSVRNEGTEFTLVVPIKVVDVQPQLTTTIQPIKSDALELSGRVLYAEDNVANQRLVKLFVERTGAVVTLACDGQEAIEILNKAVIPFDLILMDIQMPIMDGYTATRQIKASGCKIPIIALSASSLTEIKANSDILFDGYLGKPIDKYKLFAVLEDFLPAKTSAVE